MIIAIDGPAGAGKSTVAKLVGSELGLDLLDTGAMYRVFALAASRAGISEDDRSRINSLLEETSIGFTESQPRRATLNGTDVADEIRSLEISQLASQLSAISAVRRAMVKAQQQIIATGDWVLEGRDVTTVVAPNADLKIFLTASIEERARRRWVEMIDRGESVRLQTVVKEVVERDHRDYTRDDSPLMLAEDAVIIETFDISPAQVAAKIVALAKQ
ncbi:MAG: (d)CMP kinase [Fimbriimonadaceae bacterium]|nr:(d)CMP kinase [Fimbriimonadaceae bacterium]